MNRSCTRASRYLCQRHGSVQTESCLTHAPLEHSARVAILQTSQRHESPSSSRQRRTISTFEQRHRLLLHSTASSLQQGAKLGSHRRLLYSANSQRQQAVDPEHRREAVIPQTYYDIFPTTLSSGPPPAAPFAIDVRALRREFLKLQGSAHPDHHQEEQLKRRAEALSARINEAYRTLADPLLRAQYLLSLRGINVAEDETAKVEDQQLLMEVMEAQEDIEDATEEKDLVETRAKNEERIEKCIKVLEEDFANDDIDAAKRNCVRLKYWVNVREALREWEPGKEIRLVH